MNCPTNPTVSILKEKETDSTNNRLAQLCDRATWQFVGICPRHEPHFQYRTLSLSPKSS